MASCHSSDGGNDRGDMTLLSSLELDHSVHLLAREKCVASMAQASKALTVVSSPCTKYGSHSPCTLEMA